MLEIRGLAASINDKPILQGIDLTVPQGEVHAIMGPNGSGKSTLAYVLSGRDEYTVTAGGVTFDGQDLLAMAPEARAAAGVFLAFQYPVELPGVGNANFLRTALNAAAARPRRAGAGRGTIPHAGARRAAPVGDRRRHAAA
jgi:Fe-S cluster assembly ATP-binding protein